MCPHVGGPGSRDMVIGHDERLGVKEHQRIVLNGVDLNSHLVARWAAFFNVCNWPWRAETLRVVRNVPSVELRFARPLLVVITHASSLKECWEISQVLDWDGWDDEMLITMAEPGVQDGMPQIGLLGERTDLGRELGVEWGEACLFQCRECGNMSILSGSGSFRCRVCDAACDGGNGHVVQLEPEWREWDEAKRLVPRGPLG